MRHQDLVFCLIFLVSGVVVSTSFCSDEGDFNGERRTSVSLEWIHTLGLGSSSDSSTGESPPPASPLSRPDVYRSRSAPTASASNGFSPSDRLTVVASLARNGTHSSLSLPSEAQELSQLRSRTTTFHMSRPLEDLVYVERPERLHTIGHEIKHPVTRAKSDRRVNHLVTVAGPLVYLWYLEDRARLLRTYKPSTTRGTPKDAWIMGQAGVMYILAKVNKVNDDSYVRWRARDGYLIEARSDLKPDLQEHLHKPFVGAGGRRLVVRGNSVLIVDGGSSAIELSHSKSVTCANFSPYGNFVFTGTKDRDGLRDSKAYVWGVARTRQDSENRERAEEIIKARYGLKARLLGKKESSS